MSPPPIMSTLSIGYLCVVPCSIQISYLGFILVIIIGMATHLYTEALRFSKLLRMDFFFKNKLKQGMACYLWWKDLPVENRS